MSKVEERGGKLELDGMWVYEHVTGWVPCGCASENVYMCASVCGCSCVGGWVCVLGCGCVARL